MSISSHINKLAAKAGHIAGVAVDTIESLAMRLPRPLADQTDQQLVGQLGKAGFNVAILALAAKFGKKPGKAGKWLSAATLAYNVGEGVAALHELIVRAVETKAEIQEEIDLVAHMGRNGDTIDLEKLFWGGIDPETFLGSDGFGEPSDALRRLIGGHYHQQQDS